MFRLMFGNRNSTCRRPSKKHAIGSKREEYHQFTIKTLGTGDLIGAVKLPVGEDLHEWLAANTVDFYNELRLIWDIVCEASDLDGDRVINIGPGEGFPPGFEYRWADPRAKNAPTIVSGPQYIDNVLTWVEDEIGNEALFPTSSLTPFPKTFVSSIKVIFTRLFRIYAIIYTHHFLKLEKVGAATHLNTSFKHFLFFLWEYSLVQMAELEALRDLVEELKSRYGTSFAAFSTSTNASVGSSANSERPSHSSSARTSIK